MRLLAAGVFLAFVLGALPSRSAAQDVAGALSAGFVDADGDPGAVALLDLFVPFEFLRLGGFMGVSSIVSDRDERNRVMMPVGASVALVADVGVVLSLRARGGLWGGATQDVKLTLGGFVGGGVGIGFHLSPSVSVSAMIEAWGILGAGETWAVVPGLSLEWGHPVPTESVPEGVEE